MKDGFLRVAAATPKIKVADCAGNLQAILSLAREGAQAGARVIVFPELCLTGATCADLFFQRTLLEGARKALLELCRETVNCRSVLIVGLPLSVGTGLYNCAAVLYHGEILGIVSKTALPDSGASYESRYFTAGTPQMCVTIGDRTIPMGTDLLFACETMPEFVFGIELGEDLWGTTPPSSALAEAGATLLCNLSATPESIGTANYRRLLVSSQSARTLSAYLCANAGDGESTTDAIFSGHNLIAENGTILTESKRFTTGLTFADIDLQKLATERRRKTTFGTHSCAVRTVSFSMPLETLELKRFVDPHPFTPAGDSELHQRCEEIFTIQALGLVQRLRHTNGRCAVIGLSGGLDSTLALLVTVRAFDWLGLDRKGIVTVTMPCFGTTKRTKSNAQRLAEAVGCTFRDIPIKNAVTVHLEDIGHDLTTLDVTYENAQARERTQVLMDLANMYGGMVIGTGDLSELALGWATYNGDHMSMYGVNASVPKTLVRHLVRYVADTESALHDVLTDILDTPVSPELLPPKDGEISQQTENIVGPYELHDFFLFYIVRYAFSPAKILRLALHAFGDAYDRETILRWMRTFYWRFFSQQFKRSCLPDGPKVGSVTFSPRGDWRMPSDATWDLWKAELETL